MTGLRCRITVLFLSKGEDFHCQEGNGNAEDSGDEVADDVREAEHVVEDDYDDILNDVVRNVGYEKFDIAGPLHGCMKNNDAVEPVGDEIAGDITAVKGDVAVGNHKGVEPGKKGSVEGIDTADNEKEQKFPGKKVMLELFDDLQAADLLSIDSVGIMACTAFFVNLFACGGRETSFFWWKNLSNDVINRKKMSFIFRVRANNRR